MKRLVIDIETVGTPWEEHEPYVREYLIKGMSEAEAEEEKRRGALSPFTGKIVAIGVINADTLKSCAMYEVPDQTELITRKDGNRTLISGSERQILETFWEYLGKNDRFISFNGRQFDGPFLMIRSAINGIIPKRDLVGYRYDFKLNCDLREVLNFTGSINSRQMRFNLDLACRAFGIQSSKSEGMDGRAVEAMYRAGRYEEIAVYCLEDVRATCELYERLAATLLRLTLRDEDSRSSKDDQEQLMPSSERSFIDSLVEQSASLVSGIEELDQAHAPAVIAEKHHAKILEKLIKTEDIERIDEEIPEV